MSIDDDDPEFIACLAEELTALGPMVVTFRPHTVLTLVGALQLATRHPSMPPTTRAVIDTFLDGARGYFADCPFVLEAIRRGEDRTQDR